MSRNCLIPASAARCLTALPRNAPSPHDAVFRRIFGVPANAASQLRAVLASGIAARLDLGRLAPVPGSFVDEDLRWRHSDVLFTAPLDGRDAFVYVLVEHQSSDDPLMAYRMLRYVTRIWDRNLREHPRARRLPAVTPLVVHHGHNRWASPVQVADLIDLDPAAKKAVRAYLPRFEFLLDDLSGVVPKTVHAASIDQIKAWTARAWSWPWPGPPCTWPSRRTRPSPEAATGRTSASICLAGQRSHRPVRR